MPLRPSSATSSSYASFQRASSRRLAHKASSFDFSVSITRLSSESYNFIIEPLSKKLKLNRRPRERRLVFVYLLVEPPAMVPLVEPLLIEPAVLVLAPTLPGLAIVPLLAPFVVEPEVSLVVAEPFADVAALMLSPGAICLFEPSGSVADTPLVVEVAEFTDCAIAIPDEARTVQRTIERNKRDIVLSPERFVEVYLRNPPAIKMLLLCCIIAAGAWAFRRGGERVA
jgi:hypothetical protein